MKHRIKLNPADKLEVLTTKFAVKDGRVVEADVLVTLDLRKIDAERVTTALRQKSGTRSWFGAIWLNAEVKGGA